MGDQAGAGARYRAFISYSHRDKVFGRRLHRRLERYGLPHRLVGRETPRGPVPRRVAPVFRDREEFSAASDLTAEVRAALTASGALIVICSPAAQASPWVAREVELFRELHPDRPVLAALATGEPDEAFPHPLTLAGGAPVEPLAADFRHEGDGPRLAMLKLVAGVLGLGLDELVQRDAQRHVRNVTAVTAGAVAVALAMSGLTTFALLAQREAQRQRGEAEALVEFMLTDLRDRLKGVGRLDVLTTVNDRSIAYYRKQERDRLPTKSKALYARILLAQGEDDLAHYEKRDPATHRRLSAALRKFQDANAITSALLSAEPDSPDRILDQGQSEHFLGLHAYSCEEWRVARRHWTRYRELAGRLLAVAPASGDYRREAGFADGDLCSLATKEKLGRAALRLCTVSLANIEYAAARNPGDPYLQRNLANRHGWLSQVHKAAGDFDAAIRDRKAEGRILDRLMQEEPRAADLKEKWVAMQRALSGLEYLTGQDESARARLLRTRVVVDDMIALEPANTAWSELKRDVEATLALVESRIQSGRGEVQ